MMRSKILAGMTGGPDELNDDLYESSFNSSGPPVIPAKIFDRIMSYISKLKLVAKKDARASPKISQAKSTRTHLEMNPFQQRRAPPRFTFQVRPSSPPRSLTAS
jgi:hypothetical protein